MISITVPWNEDEKVEVEVTIKSKELAEALCTSSGDSFTDESFTDPLANLTDEEICIYTRDYGNPGGLGIYILIERAVADQLEPLWETLGIEGYQSVRESVFDMMEEGWFPLFNVKIGNEKYTFSFRHRLLKHL
jgi:hypothetical protein